jgi:hypothetical protein
MLSSNLTDEFLAMPMPCPLYFPMPRSVLALAAAPRAAAWRLRQSDSDYVCHLLQSHVAATSPLQLTLIALFVPVFFDKNFIFRTSSWGRDETAADKPECGNALEYRQPIAGVICSCHAMMAWDPPLLLSEPFPCHLPFSHVALIRLIHKLRNTLQPRLSCTQRPLLSSIKHQQMANLWSKGCTRAICRAWVRRRLLR